VAFTKFDAFLTEVAKGPNGVHDLTTCVFKVYLSNVAPDVTTDAIKADIAEIATGGGYSGPVEITTTSRAIASNQYVITPTGPIVWTGADAGFGPLRYAILFNDTAASDNLIGFWSYPTEITLIAADETLTLNVTSGGGLLKLI
jgi:hypothetical protein